MAENEYVWTPPWYDTSKAPQATCSYDLLPDKSFEDNFARMSKWSVFPYLASGIYNTSFHDVCRSPDGMTFLAQCENRSFQRVDLYVLHGHQKISWYSYALQRYEKIYHCACAGSWTASPHFRFRLVSFRYITRSSFILFCGVRARVSC